MSDVTLVMNQGGLYGLLDALGGDVGKDLARRAIKVETAAKRLCPVDTGRLRASITSVMATDAQGPFAVIGTDVEYGVYVELGTRFMAPQPFLRPALDAAR